MNAFNKSESGSFFVVVDNGLYEVYVNTQIDDSSQIAGLMKVFKSTEPVQDERFERVCSKLREYNGKTPSYG